MSDGIFNQSNSLFDEINKKIKETEQKTQEEELDDKMNKRSQTVNQTIGSIDEVRTDIQNKEISIRKSDREKEFHNRRLRQNKTKNEKNVNLKDKITLNKDFYSNITSNFEAKIENLSEYVSKFLSQDMMTQFEGLVAIRKTLSLANNPPIQAIIDQGLVVPLITLLENNLPEIVFEALWALTNIASGSGSDYSASIVNKGGLPKIVNLLDSQISEIQDQAVWCIGNFAGDSASVRDKIIGLKGLDKIISLLATTDRDSLIKHCTWTLTNFCRPEPSLPYESVKPFIDLILKGIFKLPEDVEFLIDATWLLSHITEKYKSSISKLLKSNFLPIIIRFLESKSINLQLHCLKILGNIVSGNPLQTQAVIDAGVLTYLSQLIFHEKRSIRKETCWVISNIAAGTQQQIKALINNNFINILEKVIKTDEPEIQKEAIWATCNLTSIENKELLEKLLNQGILETLCICLKNKESKYIGVSLEALSNILSYGKTYPVNGENPVAVTLEKNGTLDHLENLQRHHIEVIYEKTIKILETYFIVDDE